MAFDKTDYAKKRKKGERGQGPKDRGTFYPKGKKVTFINSKGEEKEWPNAAGEHLIRVPGKGLQYLNRKQARMKNRRTPATKKNYAYQNEKMGFFHDVTVPEFELPYPPGLSNHVRHRQRQVERELKKNKMKEGK